MSDDLTTYGIYELSQTIGENPYPVIREVERRQAKIEQKLERLQAQIEKLKKENLELSKVGEIHWKNIGIAA